MTQPAMKPARRHVPGVEACEARALAALVFVLNGNAYSQVGPNSLTGDAAAELRADGQRVVELAYPTIATPGAYLRVARTIRSLARGQAIGLVGFSAGGTLAARLSGIESLHVAAALDCYGPPDLRDWFRYHGDDVFGRYVRAHVPFTRATIDLLSGPSTSRAYVVAAFGASDVNVAAAGSSASLADDFATSRAYVFAGGHGAAITASRPALRDFLAHLPPGPSRAASP